MISIEGKKMAQSQIQFYYKTLWQKLQANDRTLHR